MVMVSKGFRGRGRFTAPVGLEFVAGAVVGAVHETKGKMLAGGVVLDGAVWIFGELI
jgi:hypothetical protein